MTCDRCGKGGFYRLLKVADKYLALCLFCYPGKK